MCVCMACLAFQEMNKLCTGPDFHTAQTRRIVKTKRIAKRQERSERRGKLVRHCRQSPQDPPPLSVVFGAVALYPSIHPSIHQFPTEPTPACLTHTNLPLSLPLSLFPCVSAIVPVPVAVEQKHGYQTLALRGHVRSVCPHLLGAHCRDELYTGLCDSNGNYSNSY